MVVPVGQKPQEAFIWGKGGKRQPMDSVNSMRQMGEQQMMAGADYSPVNHWTQGLARMSQGLIGGLNVRNANRREDTLLQEQAASQAAQQDAVLQALMRRGVSAEDAPVMAGLGNDAVASLIMPQGNEALSPLGKQAADEGFRPGTPEYNSRVKQLGEFDARKTIPIQAGGAAIEYNPITGEARYLVAPQGAVPEPEMYDGIPVAAIEALRRGEGTIEQFDAMFGPGAAERIVRKQMGAY